MMGTMNERQRSFIAGLIAGIVIVVVLGGVFMLGASYGQEGGSGGTLAAGGTNQGGTVPAQPTAPREGDASKIAKVSKDDHLRGDPKAKVTMIEYSDFECPFCARFRPTVDQILAEYQGKVNLVYRHFPLRSIHPQAQKAAEASECASAQGKFWEMHDKLFDLNTAGQLTLDNIKNAAGELGLNTSKFTSCVDNGEMVNAVEQDYQDGIAGGVSGTPGTFVNGQYIAGALPYEQVKAVVDQALNS